jgi:hypothetical protein
MSGSAKPLLFTALALLVWSGACGAASLTVSSPSFKDGDKMSRGASCDGGEHSPALVVSGVPGEAKTVAVLMFELDAPKRPAALWMAYNIPAAATVTVAENQPKTRQMKGDGLQLSCAAGKVGYCGPCPPQGATRRYMIEVFALDSGLDLPENATKQQFLLAVEGHILAKGKLTGKYKK